MENSSCSLTGFAQARQRPRTLPGNRAGNRNTDSRAAQNLWPTFKSTSASLCIRSGPACTLGVGLPTQAWPSQLAGLPSSPVGPHQFLYLLPLDGHGSFFGIGLLLPGISMKRKNTPGPLQSRHRRQARTCLTSLRHDSPHNPQRPPALTYWPFQLSPEPPFTESPGELVNSQMAGIQFNLISEPGRSVRICLSREFPSEADAVGPRTTCGEQVCQRMPENARECPSGQNQCKARPAFNHPTKPACPDPKMQLDRKTHKQPCTPVQYKTVFTPSRDLAAILSLRSCFGAINSQMRSLWHSKDTACEPCPKTNFPKTNFCLFIFLSLD